jgi:hypothetical protein
MEYMQCIMTEVMLNPDRLLQQHKYTILPYWQKGYSGLPKDRSVAASYALKLGCDKILFIDSDQAWTWPDLKAILDSDKPIIAGVIPLKQKDTVLNFTPKKEDYDCFEDEGNKITPQGLKRFREKYSNQDELQVELTGTGFLCVDISVLKKLSETAEQFIFYDPHSQTKQMGWAFFQCGPLNNVYFGEDWSFCHAAKHAGFPIYINSKVLIDHIGSYRFTIDRKEVFPDG